MHLRASFFCSDIVVVEEEEEGDGEEDVKTKDLVRFLGMKDGVTASMASQGRLSDDSSATRPLLQQPHPPSASLAVAAAASAASTRSSSIGSNRIDRLIQKQSS